MYKSIGLWYYTSMQKYWKKVNKTPTCWLWTGTLRGGYGSITTRGKSFYMHRVIYEELVGKIPQNLQIDHLCRNRACVNPDHLEPVTVQENIRRERLQRPIEKTIGYFHKTKTHCKNGHLFDESNTYKRGNTRYCRKCKAVRMRQSRISIK